MIVTNNAGIGCGMNQQYKNTSITKSSKYKIKTTKKNSSGITVHIGFNAAGEMARIAAANTKAQVAAIERALRAQLKTAKKYDSDESTIRAIKRVIGKANFKVKALGKEERMENLRKSAKAAEHHRTEERIRKELTAKRKARQCKERAEVAGVHSILSKNHNKYYYNIVNVSSEGITFSEGTSNDIVSEGASETVVDVCV